MYVPEPTFVRNFDANTFQQLLLIMNSSASAWKHSQISRTTRGAQTLAFKFLFFLTGQLRRQRNTQNRSNLIALSTAGVEF